MPFIWNLSAIILSPLGEMSYILMEYIQKETMGVGDKREDYLGFIQLHSWKYEFIFIAFIFPQSCKYWIEAICLHFTYII